jgi:hypothetical protein
MLEDFDFTDMDVDFGDDLSDQDVASQINDGVDLENLVHAISKYRKEVIFLKELKAKRNAPIDIKIAKCTSNEEYLKRLILELMPKLFGAKKSVDFPGVGKISKRVKKGKWVVGDKDAFIAQIEALDLGEDVIKVEKKIVAKFLASVTAEMLKTMKDDELEGVAFEDPDNDHSLAITIHEPVVEEDDDDEVAF